MITAKISDADLKRLNQRIKEIGKKLDDKTLKKIFRVSSKPYLKTVRAAAPKASKNVSRYSTAKVSKKTRAPKGFGNVVATYTPGNVGRSMKVLPLRRSKRSIIIGPKKMKSSKGIFTGARADGYYAHFLEFGTKNISPRPFVQPAWETSKVGVLNAIERELKQKIKSGI